MKRGMSHLSHELDAVIHDHDYFGYYYFDAGKTLNESWNKLIIDVYLFESKLVWSICSYFVRSSIYAKNTATICSSICYKSYNVMKNIAVDSICDFNFFTIYIALRIFTSYCSIGIRYWAQIMWLWKFQIITIVLRCTLLWNDEKRY